MAEPQPAEAEGLRRDRYFLTSDGVLARLEAGWRSQVWHASKGEWADYPELDVAGECTEIPEDEAKGRMSTPESGEGEFADQPEREEGAP